MHRHRRGRGIDSERSPLLNNSPNETRRSESVLHTRKQTATLDSLGSPRVFNFGVFFSVCLSKVALITTTSHYIEEGAIASGMSHVLFVQEAINTVSFYEMYFATETEVLEKTKLAWSVGCFTSSEVLEMLEGTCLTRVFLKKVNQGCSCLWWEWFSGLKYV